MLLKEEKVDGVNWMWSTGICKVAASEKSGHQRCHEEGEISTVLKKMRELSSTEEKNNISGRETS